MLTRNQKIAIGVASGVVVVGGGTAFWLYRRRQKGLPPLADVAKGLVDQAAGNYLGSSSGWSAATPSMPDEEAIKDALHMLGYSAAGCIVNGKWQQATDCVAALKLFQSDANQVMAHRRAIKAGQQIVLPSGFSYLQGLAANAVITKIDEEPTLPVDGRAGSDTIRKLNAVLAAVEEATTEDCLDSSGRAVSGSLAACQGAWARTVDYARAANSASAAVA